MKIICLLVALATFLYAEISDAQAQLTFRLIPKAPWEEGQRDPDSWATSDGRILLYQEGDVEPRLIVGANEVVSVPAGAWLWTAEATGFVSVVPGRIVVPASSGLRKMLIWPVVPACELILAAPRRWQGVERLDVVSVPYGTVHPVEPQHRQRVWIPAGAFLTYSVSRSNLHAIGQLRTCQAGQRIPQGPPSLPAPDHQDLMVTLGMPAEMMAPENAESLIVSLQQPQSGRGEAAVAPTIVVAQGRRRTAFFLDVPAMSDLELQVSQPDLRRARQVVEKLGGSARELPMLQLQPRLKLVLPIDYRPLRPHAKAEILVRYCAAGEPRNKEQFEGCVRLEPRSLIPGLSEYTFEKLDDGFYYFDAKIDDELLLDLSTEFELEVQAKTENPLIANTQVMREMEIYGNLLSNQEPVPGEVILQTRHEEEGPSRHFPTGDDLLYHMFFFGRLPSVRFEVHALPEDLRELDREELRGLWGFSGYSLVACAEDGSCRTFNFHSKLIGEGRLDLDLGSELLLEILVRSARTEMPLSGAQILTEDSGKALLFAHGKVTWQEPRGAERLASITGPDGMARVRNVKPGKQLLTVSKTGYAGFNEVREIPPTGGRLEINLEPKDETGGVELRFADGAPLSRGFLLRLTPDGQQDRRCSKVTDSEGRARFPAAACLQGGWIVVLHVGARLTVLPAEDLARVPQLSIERAPAVPLRLRVVDGDGVPVAGAAIGVRLGGVEIGPNELLAAASTGIPFYATDGNGEALLRGIDPLAAQVPEVFVLSGGRRVEASVLGFRPGEVVEVTMP